MTGVDLARPLVVGFGVVGRALATSLGARGVTPTVIEDRPTDDARNAARALGVELVESPTSDTVTDLVRSASVLLPSPGVPDAHPAIVAAGEHRIAVRSEFDLAHLWDDRPILAVTGTNGKTTVVTVITDALQRSGRVAAAVGNTEVPLITALEDDSIEVFVVEASSFRLGHSERFSPQVATWINFAPDHLDAHASVEAYERAKASIWAHLAPDALAVANADDPVVMAHLPDGVATQTFSLRDHTADWHVADGQLVGPDGPLVSVAELARSRPHDLANALAVAGTALAGGAAEGATAEAIATFTGLSHRLEFVGEWGGVGWYNDSKATVPQATQAAASGFGSVVLIAGGRNKGLSLDVLAETVPPVHHVVAIGDAAEDVAAVFAGVANTTVAGSMAEAVEQAASASCPGDIVLLSPGCTSFDWYRNYGERGHDFTRLVRTRAGAP